MIDINNGSLAAMSEFVESFIDTGNMAKCERLIRALLELIEEDESITDTDPLYICMNGRPLDKAVIRSMEDICLPAFLLGLWHFIVTSRADNTIGRNTFLQWHKAPEMKGQQWRFTSRIGEGITRSIHVSVLGPKVSATEQKADATGEAQPLVEDATEDASAKESHTDNNQYVFNQFGNSNVQIGKIDMLTINNG